MDLRYPVILTHDDGAYSVQVPDLDGCFSWGETVNEALSNAQEAISLWLQDAATGKGEVPTPSDIDTKYWVAPSLDVRVPILLRMRRKEFGWTQKGAAEQLGVTYQVYQRYESPKVANLTLRTLSKVLTVFRLDFVLAEDCPTCHGKRR